MCGGVSSSSWASGGLAAWLGLSQKQRRTLVSPLGALVVVSASGKLHQGSHGEGPPIQKIGEPQALKQFFGSRRTVRRDLEAHPEGSLVGQFGFEKEGSQVNRLRPLAVGTSPDHQATRPGQKIGERLPSRLAPLLGHVQVIFGGHGPGGGRAGVQRASASSQSKPWGATRESRERTSAGSTAQDKSRSTISLDPSIPSARGNAKTILGRGVKPWLRTTGTRARLSIRSTLRMRSWWLTRRMFPRLANRRRNLLTVVMSCDESWNNDLGRSHSVTLLTGPRACRAVIGRSPVAGLGVGEFG